MLFVFFRFSGGQQKTGLEFLMADRGAGVVPVACSLMASFISAISLLGVTRQTLVININFQNQGLSRITNLPPIQLILPFKIQLYLLTLPYKISTFMDNSYLGQIMQFFFPIVFFGFR